jgi:hypothetical protein
MRPKPVEAPGGRALVEGPHGLCRWVGVITLAADADTGPMEWVLVQVKDMEAVAGIVRTPDHPLTDMIIPFQLMPAADDEIVGVVVRHG